MKLNPMIKRNQVSDTCSIAQIHGLDEHDPWQTKPKQKELDEAESKKRLEEAGVTPIDIPSEGPPFEDLYDNEDMRIANENSMSIFWRMVVPNQRLIRIVELEPTVTKIALAARNNRLGCWLAFTSKRVGKRVSEKLRSAGIDNDFHSCDIFGNQIGDDVAVNNIIVAHARPWNAIEGDDRFADLKPEEFFYCLIENSNDVLIYFVPESFWNEHKTVFNGELGFENLNKRFSTSLFDKPYAYKSWHDLDGTRNLLNSFGFRENLFFQNFIYESDL